MNAPQPEGHMASHIGRRKFLATLGGAAAWPLAARAQGERLRRIGVVMGLPASDPGSRSEFAALKQGLEDLGWIDGRNLEIKDRWSGESDHVQASAKELVGLPCELIIARSTPVTAAVLKETHTIPIVFAIVGGRSRRARSRGCFRSRVIWRKNEQLHFFCRTLLPEVGNQIRKHG